MYDSKNITYILTILEAIEKIHYYSSAFSNADDFFDANRQLNFNASVNLLIAIGEENKKIDTKLQTSDKISWKNISAMRDKISHNYRGIDESMVWDIIQNYLPILKQLLVEMLPNIDQHELYIEEALKSDYYKDLLYLKP